jgi:DNA repair protein RadC
MAPSPASIREGDPAPTAEDMTRWIDLAGRTVGIPLIDHVIVCASGEHASFLALGILRRI